MAGGDAWYDWLAAAIDTDTDTMRRAKMTDAAGTLDHAAASAIRAAVARDEAYERVISTVSRMLESAQEAALAGTVFPGPYLGDVEDLLDELATAAVAVYLAGVAMDTQRELADSAIERERAELRRERGNAEALGDVPIEGEDELGRWWSRHHNGYRAPEVVAELEAASPTLVRERKRETDFTKDPAPK